MGVEDGLFFYLLLIIWRYRQLRLDNLITHIPGFQSLTTSCLVSK